MWIKTEVICPRILRSLLWIVIFQECYIVFFFLLFKVFSGNPLAGVVDWVFYLIHWKTLIYQGVLCGSTLAFGALNLRYYSVQKDISSTRFQKIWRAFSPSRVQHFLATAALGGITSFCCIGLFHSFDPEKTSLFSSCIHLENEFEYFFVIQHGCYTGIMFSLKYFICCLYLLKFTLDQKTKLQCIKSQIFEMLKESVVCVLKAVFWYYLVFFIVGPFLQNSVLTFSKIHLSTIENTLYSMLSPKLFFVTFISGVIIFFNWSVYLFIFNTCAVEQYLFTIEMPTKNESNKCLSVALQGPQFDILKYLAMMDLRLLAQHDIKRRQQIFAISHPGGHPYQWKAISEVCVSSLQDLLEKLRSYAMAVAAKEFRSDNQKKVIGSAPNLLQNMEPRTFQKLPGITEKLILYIRGWPAVAYFFEELPNAKIRQIFSASQPLVWMAEALGFLLSASYVEDKFGVVQQNLPSIVCLLLDLKMAEEKLPIDPIEIKTHVRDPQDRYEHIHQRLALKTAVNSSLCRIATTFKDDVTGIYLPDEYNRYFQRFICRKTV